MEPMLKKLQTGLIMTKLDEQNAEGGKQRCCILMIGSTCEDLFKDPVGRQDFIWGSPKSKNVNYKVEHPIFHLMKKADLIFHILISSRA